MRVAFRVVPMAASVPSELFNPSRAIASFVMNPEDVADDSERLLRLSFQCLDCCKVDYADSFDIPAFLNTVLISFKSFK